MERVGNTLPVVDDTWIRFHPEHAKYKGEPLEHHHVGQGSRAVPMPRKLHDAYTVWHPERQVVAEHGKKPEALKPRPTAERQTEEIGRHVKERHIKGREVKPPKSGAPLSSEIAAVPPSERRPVAPRELEELRRLDPATGTVPSEKKPPRSKTRKDVGTKGKK
jgi:HNH/Endo VII superfamily nuclease toxin with a HHH motif